MFYFVSSIAPTWLRQIESESYNNLGVLSSFSNRSQVTALACMEYALKHWCSCTVVFTLDIDCSSWFTSTLIQCYGMLLDIITGRYTLYGLHSECVRISGFSTILDVFYYTLPWHFNHGSHCSLCHHTFVPVCVCAMNSSLLCLQQSFLLALTCNHFLREILACVCLAKLNNWIYILPHTSCGVISECIVSIRSSTWAQVYTIQLQRLG